MSKKNFYNFNLDELKEYFKVDFEKGLSNNEVIERKQKYGLNKLVEQKKKTPIQIFFAQLKSFMILILIVAAVVSGIIGLKNGEGLLDTYIILGIVILNAVIGTVQELKAQSSLEALKKLSSPKVKVIREEIVEQLSVEDLVPGDIVYLETGDLVPADLRLIECVNLKIQESAMTGESVPNFKNSETIDEANLALGDRFNMAFSSGIVTYGRGKGVVVATGMDTEIGKIAGMLQNTKPTETPMSKRLEHSGKVLGISVIIICAIIFLVGLLYGNKLIDVLMIAISLSVAAIPEGLPAISTIVLAIGVKNMVKQNAIIKTLPSVETLGSATVICSDKTGTLTQNKMTVMKSYQYGAFTNVQEKNTKLSDSEIDMLHTFILCNDTILSDGETNGDPTETSLVDLGLKFNLDKNELEKKYKRVDEIPFDSERKLMTTINERNGSYRINTKGGLDEILSICNRILVNGEIVELEQKHIDELKKVNEQVASEALRVLAAAYKDADTLLKDNKIDYEQNLIFLGFVGMIDPPREEAKVSVAKCHSAGIKPVMITGDHKITATAIANELGILKENNEVVTGTELEEMSDEDLFNKIENCSVFARVAPEHKVRIVDAFQQHGEVVAMTGDGVNDAPALKKADIGLAMGIVGTDVAKDAADVILTDDNFSTIVVAVEEGRRIYDNILKAVQFLLSCNIGEILLLFIASILNLGTPLLPIHILWINLVTDSLPAIALSMDPAQENIMDRRPINSKKGLFTKGMIWRISYQGFLFGIFSLIAFIIGKNYGSKLSPQYGLMVGQTMAFITLTLTQLVHVRNLHSNKKSFFKTSLLHNTYLLGAIAISLLFMLVVLFVPTFRGAFRFATLNTNLWLIAIGLSIAPLFFVELFKSLNINTSKDEY